jgi:hypothetical protein
MVLKTEEEDTTTKILSSPAYAELNPIPRYQYITKII